MVYSFYIPADSFLHRLDARCKLINLIIIFILSLCFNHPIYLTGLLIGILLLVAVAKAYLLIKQFRKLILLLFIFCSILWPFFVDGKNLILKFYFMEVYYESLLYGIAMGIRINIMVIASLLLLAVTKFEEITVALNRLGLPQAVCFAISTSLRLVPTFATATSTIIQAQRSRGLNLEEGNILVRIRNHIPLIIPILSYAIRNTNYLAAALESKGFGRRNIKIEHYIELKFKKSDYLLLLIMVGLLILCLYLRINGYGIVIDRI